MPFSPPGQFYIGNAFAVARAAGLATTSTVAGKIILAPAWVFRAVSVASLAIRLQSSVADNNLRIGLYADNGNTPKGARLIFDSGDLPMSGAGNPTITTTPAQALALQRGIYWAALQTQVAVNYYLLEQPLFADLSGELLLGGEFTTTPKYGPFPATGPDVLGDKNDCFAFNMRVSLLG